MMEDGRVGQVEGWQDKHLPAAAFRIAHDVQ
jgi:hypothetical protein